MEDRSENEIVTRLLELENGDQAERRVRLAGERYLSLLQDPDTGRSYVFRHGVDDTREAEVAEDTEFYEYDTIDVARRAFNQLLGEAKRAGTVVEEDSTDDMGALETDGAEIRDLYADVDEDELTQDDVLSEEDA